MQTSKCLGVILQVPLVQMTAGMRQVHSLHLEQIILRPSWRLYEKETRTTVMNGRKEMDSLEILLMTMRKSIWLQEHQRLVTHAILG